MTRLSRLLRLPPRQRRVVAEAFIALPAARVALATLGVKRTYRLFEMLSSLGRPREAGGAEMASVAVATARLVRAAAIHGRSGATCLPRALVTWAILRREGIACVVRIGTRRREGKFEAHAWIEAEGQKIDLDAGGEIDPFVPFDQGSLAAGLRQRT